MRAQWIRRVAAGIGTVLIGVAIASCGGKSGAKKGNPPGVPGAEMLGAGSAGERIVMDFEEPGPAVAWESASAASQPRPESQPASQPSSQPAAEEPVLSRSSLHPNTGLWSLTVKLSGEQSGRIAHRFIRPVDLQQFDIVSAAVLHTGDPSRSGEWRATVYLEDADGNRVVGDPYPVTTQWRTVTMDLRTASEEGVDLSRVTGMGVELTPAQSGKASALPLAIQTDTWEVKRDAKTYVGQKSGPAKSFYVARRGTRLEVGMVGQYAITFYDRAIDGESVAKRPWMTVEQAGARVMGEHGTGLMLLDQGDVDGASAAVREDAFDPKEAGHARMPIAGWPEEEGIKAGGISEWSWECAWTSPVAAMVVVRQNVGPFDALGEPAASLKWRFMIYQWGQVFVHVEWTKSSAENGKRVGNPISWGLVLDRNAGVPTLGEEGIKAKTAAGAERLLDAIYPAAVRNGLKTALPDRMQRGAAVAMLAKTGGAGRNWWWAADTSKRLFGVGVTDQAGPLDCMLLINNPTQLMQAGSFSQYLVPPKVRVREGELDRNFPGDVDNDSLVEPYGFQVIRLQNGRTEFTIYPQERPLFYPPFLFTVPAVERAADDVKDSRMLINIDGQQFADPPVFPDGSFLLQMPYVIDRPVEVEGILVKK